MNGAGRKVAAIFLGAHVGGELDGIPRRLSSCASEAAGKRWPPVPPAASRIGDAVASSHLLSHALYLGGAQLHVLGAMRGGVRPVGRFRVRPSAKPMVSAMASSEEPP